MVKRMLIDATHAEETRVVVMSGTRLEEFDVETSTKKQLKGNIYLAKIVRVEPSLQAAFVDYGGGRHGFLAFSEIHPDYYQIPVADRQRLLAEHREVIKQSATAAAADFGDTEGDEHKHHPVEVPAERLNGEDEAAGAAAEAVALPEDGEAPVELVGGDDSEDVERRRPFKSLRHYKIQEVIKRRQIVLVQVVKEERGNKGAALTTYLSLAGRYCVLMPNTARGGGVSRKITNAADRKRLKAIANDLDIPEGMAVIIRTAGSERTKPEIKRDYEYLLRLWDSVRELTLKSVAPTLVYEEANLIKRSIRDLYSRDIDEIQVDGEEGYRLAKDFMRMLTPSHARKVQLFRDPTMPLFHKFQVESQLDAMHSPIVQLRSGGYLVINQTEALVAIDVNSGRSTKERHIEETALKTNCEAADEVARQLRLRDLAGLIVIDFIDMEETRNNHTVERRLKEAMRFDRARIQLGKISPFGLLELSRQRLRPSLMETSFQPCSHCGGSGVIRSVESASVHVLRAIEEEGVRHRSTEVTVAVHPNIALYILNQKRTALAEIEARYGFRVLLTGDENLIPPVFRMERVKAEAPIEIPQAKPIQAEQVMAEEIEEEHAVEEEKEEKEEVAAVAVQPVNGGETRTAEEAEAVGEDDDGKRRRRRRRRRGRREEGAHPLVAEGGETTEAETAEAPEGEAAEVAVAEDEGSETIGAAEGELAEGDASPRRRRRGKRGGRRRHRRADGLEGMEPIPADHAAEGEALEAAKESAGSADEPVVPVALEPVVPTETMLSEAPAEPAKPKRSRSRKKPAAVEPAVEAAVTLEAEPATEAPAKPKRSRSRKKADAPATAPVEALDSPAPAAQPPSPAHQFEPTPVEPAAELAAESGEAAETNPVAAPPIEEKPAEPAGPRRRGWWNRLLQG
jgi:ribonuclease E